MPVATKPLPRISESDKLRFFSKISTTPTSEGCLEWLASRDRAGYGQFHINRKPFKPHRVAYFLAAGIDPAELCCCHHCDNPSCCNAAHIFLGTSTENTADRTKKGRSANQKGEANRQSKLTEAQVIVIRSDTRSLREIAIDYGVAQTLISKIKLRKRWAHVA